MSDNPIQNSNVPPGAIVNYNDVAPNDGALVHSKKEVVVAPTATTPAPTDGSGNTSTTNLQKKQTLLGLPDLNKSTGTPQKDAKTFIAWLDSDKNLSLAAMAAMVVDLENKLQQLQNSGHSSAMRAEFTDEMAGVAAKMSEVSGQRESAAMNLGFAIGGMALGMFLSARGGFFTVSRPSLSGAYTAAGTAASQLSTSFGNLIDTDFSFGGAYKTGQAQIAGKIDDAYVSIDKANVENFESHEKSLSDHKKSVLDQIRQMIEQKNSVTQQMAQKISG